MTIFKEETLANGLRITFADESNRYFGDYHRVCVAATISCSLQDLPADRAGDDDLRRQAVAAFGDTLAVVKRFERMGVPSADVAEVRAALVDSFLEHAAGYLSRPAYRRSLVLAELHKRRTHRPYG